jgi:nucleoside phosphorylase
MVAYGNKDKSLQVSRGTYRTALYALSKKYFLLWDVGYKRGWLMNGTNALLHLLRASLEFNKIDDMSFAFLFKPEHFKEAKDPYTVSAAMEVLMNPENLNIELYEESEPCEQDEVAYFRVRDRVNNLYETLEKMLDYQSMITIERGEGLNITPRKYLERWDFKDIATNEDPIYPRLAKLKTIGKGWVDFTRDIQAIPLFGRGFGELIEPVDKWDVCGYWQTLPSYKFLLAISMEDLSRIMDRLGHPNLDPPRLTDTIVWHPYKIVSTTTCTCSQDTVNHCQLAQCLWPLHMGQEFKKGTSLPLKDIGAVAFGHNTGIGWMWNDFGDPERGDPPSSVEESDDDDLVDSGIGSSILLSIGPQPQEHLGFESSTHAFKHEDYKIAIICALPKELRAIRAIFDSPHQDLPRRENDTNTYVLGRVGSHNVIAACLPYEESGTNAASKVASDMEKSFPSVKWYFVVGIGGGVPSKKHDIRLGDVVVSTAIIQHDKGKRIQDNSKFQSTGIIHRPARSLMTAISRLQSDLDIRPHFLEPHIERILNLRPEYRSPEREDKLFEPHSQHEDGQETCKNCMGPEVHRKSRSAGPHVHYGLIASGNQVIKDATVRDRMGTEMEVLCFEMEGAGVMTTGQCLIIRGISDYADSHKNDEWHNYAAATAAAYTKFFLLRFPNLDVLNREVIHIQKRPALLEKNDSCRLDYRINRSERSATALASAGAFDEIAALDVYTVSLFLFLLLFFVLFVFYF